MRRELDEMRYRLCGTLSDRAIVKVSVRWVTRRVTTHSKKMGRRTTAHEVKAFLPEQLLTSPGLRQFEACLLSTSALKASKSYPIPLRTVLQWRTVAAVATASRISASVAPFARAFLVWE